MNADLFRNILFSLSGLSFGAALYALVVHAIRLPQDPVGHLGHIFVKLAWLLAIGMVFKSVIVPIAAIPPTWEGYVYMAGLAFGAVGFVMVARSTARNSHASR